MSEQGTLTREDALILLDEFKRILPALEAGDPEEEVAEQAPRLVRSLLRLPLPPDVLEEHVGEIKGWTEVLLKSDEEERKAGVGSIPTFLEERLQRLRMMVDAGSGT